MANKNKSKSGSHDSKSSKVNDPVVHKAAPGHEEDLIIVPKERSKFYYLLMLGLMMFTLLIFTVGGLFETVVGGGGGSVDEVVLRWTKPDGEEQEVKASDFQLAMRSVDLLANLGLYRPVQGLEEGIDQEDGVLTLILDELAKDSGVEISAAEFRKRLLARGFDKAVISNIADRYRRTQRQIEEEIVRGLRIEKLTSMVYSLASLTADPEEVVQRWQELNPEYQFQVVELSGESFLDQAKAEVPSDEELTDWFHARPAFEQRALFTEEKLLPMVAYVDLESEYDLTNLLDLYPAPPEWDEALQAQTYYNRYTTTRFKRPEEPKDDENGENSEDDEGDENSESDTAEQDQPLYYTFEEVEEQVKREANIARALGQFATD